MHIIWCFEVCSFVAVTKNHFSYRCIYYQRTALPKACGFLVSSFMIQTINHNATSQNSAAFGRHGCPRFSSLETVSM